jgi:outer membrane protein TolC
MQKHKTVFVVLLILSLTIRAQIVSTISLDTLFVEVEKNNYDIRLSEKEFQLARSDFRKSNSNFLPKLSISHTGISTTNPLMAFGSKLNQEILNPNDFNPDLLNNPNAIENFTTQISVFQPLVNADGLEQRKALKLQMEAREMQQKRTKEYLRFEVSRIYMQLQLAHAQLIVIKKAEETAHENQKVAQNFYDQGLLQRSELLRVEIHLNSIKNQKIQINTMIQNLSDAINYIRGKPLGELLIPENELQKSTNLIEFNNLVSNSRADVLAMEKGKSSAEHMYKADKMGLLPRLNAFASYEMHDNKIAGVQRLFDRCSIILGSV